MAIFHSFFGCCLGPPLRPLFTFAGPQCQITGDAGTAWPVACVSGRAAGPSAVNLHGEMNWTLQTDNGHTQRLFSRQPCGPPEEKKHLSL